MSSPTWGGWGNRALPFLRSSWGRCATCPRYRRNKASGVCPAKGRLWWYSALTGRPRDLLWATVWCHLCSCSESQGGGRWAVLAKYWGFWTGLWVFVLFVSQSPSVGDYLYHLSPVWWLSSIVALLLIKQNKADCSRWLRIDRSRYCYQHTKKPFIKVLSDPKLWIYQFLLINGIKPSPVWVCLGLVLLLYSAAPSGTWPWVAWLMKHTWGGGRSACRILLQEAGTCTDLGMGALLVRTVHTSCLGKWALGFLLGWGRHSGQLLSHNNYQKLTTRWNEGSSFLY